MLPEIEPILPAKTEWEIREVRENPDAYVYEQKMDGWRCLAYISHREVELQSKTGNPYKHFKAVKLELASLGFAEAIFDGEIVCLDMKGNPDYRKLRSTSRDVCYYMFDVLHLDGLDATILSHVERKKLLRLILQGGSGRLRYVPHYENEEAIVFKDKMFAEDLEGVVAKLKDAPYKASVRANWVKLLNPNYSKKRKRSKQERVSA